MRAYITRDSVHVSDDTTAPNTRRCRVPDGWSWTELVDLVWRASDLPSKIAGGRATWVLASGVPLAVAAQQWDQPQVLPRLDVEREQLDIVGDEIRFHWSYLAQVDPAMVLEVLKRVRLKAPP
jgi:hypothetical protein